MYPACYLCCVRILQRSIMPGVCSSYGQDPLHSSISVEAVWSLPDDPSQVDQLQEAAHQKGTGGTVGRPTSSLLPEAVSCWPVPNPVSQEPVWGHCKSCPWFHWLLVTGTSSTIDVSPSDTGGGTCASPSSTSEVPFSSLWRRSRPRAGRARHRGSRFRPRRSPGRPRGSPFRPMHTSAVTSRAQGESRTSYPWSRTSSGVTRSLTKAWSSWTTSLTPRSLSKAWSSWTSSLAAPRGLLWFHFSPIEGSFSFTYRPSSSSWRRRQSRNKGGFNYSLRSFMGTAEVPLTHETIRVIVEPFQPPTHH